MDTIKGDKFSVLAVFNKFLFAGSGNNVIVYDLSPYYSAANDNFTSVGSSANATSTLTKSASSGSLVKDASSIVTTLRGHLDIIEALCYNSEYLFSGSADKGYIFYCNNEYKQIYEYGVSKPGNVQRF